jgi:hypothetical protein
VIAREKPSNLEQGHKSQSYSIIHVKKTLGALLWLSMQRHLWFPSVAGKRLSTYGFKSIDMWLHMHFCHYWQCCMKQLCSNELLGACTKIGGRSTMSTSNALRWLCLVFHVITPGVSSITNWHLQSIRTWSVPMCHPDIRSIDISICWDVLTMSVNRHVHKTWLHANIMVWCPPSHMTLHSWSMIHEYLLI